MKEVKGKDKKDMKKSSIKKNHKLTEKKKGVPVESRSSKKKKRESSEILAAQRDNRDKQECLDEVQFLIDSLFDYVELNKDTYFICEHMGNIFHIVKKIKMNVTEVNNNSIFQPYESKEERTCIISFLIEVKPTILEFFDDRGEEFIDNLAADAFFDVFEGKEYFYKLKRIGCVTSVIRRKEDIPRILEGIKK